MIVSGHGSRVIEGVKAGTKLGAIQIRNGYAVLKHPFTRELARKRLDSRRWAQAKRGVPLGNGRNLGLVRSRIHNGPSGIGGDSARTGVPNAFSVDPAGDGKIDVLNPRAPRSSAHAAASAPAGAFALLPEATSSKIGPGDVLVQRVTSGGAVSEVPGTVKFVFTSEPALQSWSSGTDSATVTYPVAANQAGTTGNPWQIGAGAGDVVLKFTFWRPQRAGITGAGEAASMDIGHLHYISRPAIRATNGSVLRCPQSSYSTTDPNMAVGTDGQEAFVADQSNDAPSNPANTLSYSLDLTNCAAANGQTLNSGEEIDVDVSGRSPSSGDNAGTNYTFRIR